MRDILGLFNDEERELLKSSFKTENMNFGKKAMLHNIKFAIEISNEEDTMIIKLLNEIYGKIQEISEEEWDILKNTLIIQ